MEIDADWHKQYPFAYAFGSSSMCADVLEQLHD
jgi:hypothetical protein